MNDVGEPRDRSNIMFSLLDEDDDGFFGNDQEKLHFFDGIDYNGKKCLYLKGKFMFLLSFGTFYFNDVCSIPETDTLTLFVLYRKQSKIKVSFYWRF